LFGSGYGLFSLGFLGQFCMWVSSAHKVRSTRVTFKNYLNTCNRNFGSLWWWLLLNLFSFNWIWLIQINWFRGVILLIPIILVPWDTFSLCHTPIRLSSASRDQISILIVGCVTTWSRDSHQIACPDLTELPTKRIGPKPSSIRTSIWLNASQVKTQNWIIYW
jgi:hypothetical protein